MTSYPIVINDRSIQYEAEADDTDFDFDFPIQDVDGIKVTVLVSGETEETTLEYGTDYTVSGVDEVGGGTVTLLVGATAGDIVALNGNTEISRTNDYQPGGAVRAELLNADLDTQIQIMQELRRDADRTMRLADTAASGISVIMPPPDAGKALKWSADGLSLVSSDLDPDANAAASAASAVAAAASAGEASGSAADAAAAVGQAEAARDVTLDALDHFDDRYLGAFTSDPVTDNDGDPLVGGALYFNSASEGMKVYTGSSWVAAYVAGGMGIPMTVITGTTSISTSELGKCIASASGNTVSLQHTTVTDDIGGWVLILNTSTTLPMTITKTSGANVRSSQGSVPFTLPPGGAAWARVTAAGYWIVEGSGLGPSAADVAAISDSVAVIQTAYAELATSDTTMALIPLDDSIPQQDEGEEVLTCSITPTRADSYLLITASWNLTEDTNTLDGAVVAALFRDSSADSICAQPGRCSSGAGGSFAALDHAFQDMHCRVASGSTSATTIKLRLGGEAAGTYRWNGWSGGRKLGGSQRIAITIFEVI